MITLVTGAAGFLGSHVARQLVARGENVRVLVRASSSNRAISDLPLEYVTGDLRDPASLERAMNGVQRVFHVAADYRLWARRSQDIYDSNVGGTKNLLQAATHAGIEQLVYTSPVATIAVDRPELPNEFTDSKLDEMVGHYKRSKWMAEQEVLQSASYTVRLERGSVDDGITKGNIDTPAVPMMPAHASDDDQNASPAFSRRANRMPAASAANATIGTHFAHA